MQGRIIQVIKMRPSEILSLIEEAKGTSAYLSQKKNAQAIIFKKEQKLAEVERVIEEDVLPKYRRLMEEKQNCDRHKEICEQIDEKKRLQLAYDYSQLKDRVSDKAGSRRELERHVEQYAERIAQFEDVMMQAKQEHDQKL